MPRVVVALAFASSVLGCGVDEPYGAPLDGGGGSAGVGGTGGGAGTSSATFSVRATVEQIYVTHAEPGETLELVDTTGATVASGLVDELGSLVLRGITPGSGYVVATADGTERSAPIEVLSFSGSAPPQSFYQGQKLGPGYQYLTMRDGTSLSAYVTLPGPVEGGPYPTIVTYSGYDPSKPGAPLGDYQAMCGALPALCDAPSDPSALIAALMGYATVGVNIRGTGCSGGAYDFFEPLQLLDGYDVIETVAAQQWVLGHRVGMTGLSYPGITQLFVATTQPPSLAAITPLSVIGNTITTLIPGGILNDGFALSWAQHVLDKADPYGQGWEQAQVDTGDAVCEENQLLHGQKVDIIQKAYDNPFYTPEVVDPLNPTVFVDRIEVPVFLAGAWQDEQTGPYFFTLLDRFANAPLTRFTVYNGVHADGFSPQVLVEWKTFLDLYVAERVPSIDAAMRTMAPMLFKEIFGAMLQLPPDRLADHPTHASALAAYQAEPALRVIFESGGDAPLGAPQGRFEVSFPAWPPAGTTPRRWYFQPDGSLGDDPPAADGGASSWSLDPAAGQRGILAPGANLMDPLPAYAWNPLQTGKAVAFESAPLPQELVMIGSGSVDLWLRSSVEDADVEVNLTEVRPDGQEMYVQSGWLRASARKLAPGSSVLWPEHTFSEADSEPLPSGQWAEVRVGLAGFQHVFRAGSRLRIAVDTPGDSRAEWRFRLKELPAGAAYDVGHAADVASSLVLPVVAGVTVPTALPLCPSLRGQQCRAHVPLVNQPAQ